MSETSVYTAGILTVSDTASVNPTADRSGPLLKELLEKAQGFAINKQTVVPDDVLAIQNVVREWSDVDHLNLILITGGTGFAPRDTTPEAVAPLLTRPTPGLTHLILARSTEITPLAALSRPVTGIRHTTLIITFPGSPKACQENLSAIIDVIPHGMDLMLDTPAKTHKKSHGHGGHHHHHHHCKPKSHTQHQTREGHEQGSSYSAPLDTPVALRARKSPYPMVSIEEASAIVSKYAQTLGTVVMPLSTQLVGHVLAKDVVAAEPVPGYPASIVDGYAVYADDGPGVYPVSSVSLATKASEAVPLARGTVARTATGGLVHPGANAVVMVEDTRLVKMSEDGKTELQVEILAKVEPGENIRTVGSDCSVGTTVGFAGQLITTVGGELGVLASVGLSEVCVYRKPRVGVLSTGNEVVEPTAQGALSPGEVRDTNRITLLCAVQNAGFEAVDLGIIRDHPDTIEAHLQSALSKVDVLISTGGVSMGEADFMKPVLEHQLKAKIHFGRVFMKPGKPTTFATVPMSEGQDRLVFALPGNPVSAIVTFHVFVLPALRKMAGYKQYENAVVQVKLADPIQLDPRPEFHRVKVSATPTGLVAYSTGNQRSSRMLSVQQANGLLPLPASTAEISSISTAMPCILIGPLNTGT